MLDWILIIGIASFIIGLLLNTFYTYIPVGRIEKAIDKAITNLEGVGKKVETTAEKVDNIVDIVKPDITEAVAIVNYCLKNPTICKTILSGII